MKPKSPASSLGLLAAALSALIATAAQAYPTGSNGTWTNDNSSPWSTTSNWSGGTVADGSGFTADFSTINITTANRTVNLDSARTIGNLIFGDTNTSSAFNWTLDNNATPANVLTLAGGTPTITVNPLGNSANVINTATISAIIDGTTGLTKAGLGKLVLSGVNTYTGGTNINAGVLNVANASALGSSGTISFGGGILQYGGITTDFSARFSTAANQAIQIDTIGSSVTFAMAMTSVGGSLTKHGPNMLTLPAANTYSGLTDIRGGTLALGASNALGAGNVRVDTRSADTGSACLAIGANSDTVGTVTVDGEGRITGSGGTLTSTGSFEMKRGFASAILGGSGVNLNKTTGGLVILSGANTYTGTTTVAQGVLRLSAAAAIPGGILNTGGTSALTINGGVVELANGDFQRDLGTGSTQFQITGGVSGFSASAAARTVTVNNDATQTLT